MAGTPGDEHIADAVLQHQGRLLGDPHAVTVSDVEIAAALGPGVNSFRDRCGGFDLGPLGLHSCGCGGWVC
jgi:hypothetical protein